MKKPRPGDRGRERGGSGFSSGPFRNTAPVAPFQAPQAEHLDAIAVAKLRRIWWDQIRLGHRLPAEPGLILLSGSVDQTWPRPKTMRPEREAGGPGGRR